MARWKKYTAIAITMYMLFISFAFWDLIFITVLSLREKNVISIDPIQGLRKLQPQTLTASVNINDMLNEAIRIEWNSDNVMSVENISSDVDLSQYDVKFHDYIPSVPVGSSVPRIPHIIHQTWDSEKVPAMFSASIRSWTRVHPNWEYWFWTPKEVEVMLKTHYPEYLSLYGNYSEAIFKANIMRYFIMHKYGGVYADLDLESLRPLDNWTMDNECIMSLNHYVHTFIAARKPEPEVMITFLASRPGHPYFKKAIDMLHTYKDMQYEDKLLYANTVYQNYNNSSESKQPENRITVTHPDYFLPTFDKGWTSEVRRICSRFYSSKLTANQIRACAGINDGTWGTVPKAFSYTNHYWEHVIMWKTKADKDMVHVRNLVPDVVSPRI